MQLQNKTIVLGVTGGIAAYKACDIIGLLKKEGANVFVAVTKNATEFITPLTLETLSGNRVVTNTFSRDFEYNTKHISLAQKADLFVIAPATANFIAKYTTGVADDFLSTTILATTVPVLIAPAMNNNMLQHPATQQNIATLQSRGVYFIEGELGMLACGVVGKGRLAKPSDIVAKIISMLQGNANNTSTAIKLKSEKKNEIASSTDNFRNKTFLITTGGTTIDIDPVRFIANHSSGKMGLALALAAKNVGAKVILITGKVEHSVAEKIAAANFDKVINVCTTADMHKASIDNLKAADYIIKAAAPSDYIIDSSSSGESSANSKIKKEQFTLTLKKTTDIAAEIGKVKGNKKLIIFAAETENLIDNAKQKLKRKNADMVIANQVNTIGAGFNCDTNIVTIITNKAKTELPLQSKTDVAQKILEAIGAL